MTHSISYGTSQKLIEWVVSETIPQKVSSWIDPCDGSWDDLWDEPSYTGLSHGMIYGVSHGTSYGPTYITYIGPWVIKCAMGRPMARPTQYRMECHRNGL